MIKSWDKNSEIRHNQIISGKDISFDKVLVPEFINLIKSFNNYQDISVLEIGCGTGELSNIISKLVSSVHGFDPSKHSIKIAKEYNENNLNVKLENFDLLEAKYTTKFDLICSNMVFHTIDKVTPGFKKTKSLLKNDGFFSFSLPHPVFFSRMLFEKFKGDYQYIREYRLEIPLYLSNDRNPLPEKVPYFHRPISYYFNTLRESGFRIVDLIEPFPDPGVMELYPESWSNPRFLFFICI